MFLRDLTACFYNVKQAILREVGRLSFPEMQILLQIIGHFPPRQLQVRPIAKDPAYEELVSPERLREFAVKLSGISGWLKPEVVSFFSFYFQWGETSILYAGDG